MVPQASTLSHTVRASKLKNYGIYQRRNSPMRTPPKFSSNNSVHNIGDEATQLSKPLNLAAFTRVAPQLYTGSWGGGQSPLCRHRWSWYRSRLALIGCACSREIVWLIGLRLPTAQRFLHGTTTVAVSSCFLCILPCCQRRVLACALFAAYSVSCHSFTIGQVPAHSLLELTRPLICLHPSLPKTL